MKLDHYFIPYTKINFKWIKEHRPGFIKLLEENISGKLLNIGLGDDLSDSTPKAKETKVKTSGTTAN